MSLPREKPMHIGLRRAGLALLLTASALLVGATLDGEGPRKVRFVMAGILSADVGGVCWLCAFMQRRGAVVEATKAKGFRT